MIEGILTALFIVMLLFMLLIDVLVIVVLGAQMSLEAEEYGGWKND